MTHSAPKPGVALVYDLVYPFTLGGVEHRNDQIARRLVGHRPVALYGFAYWTEAENRCRPGVSYVSVGAARPIHTATGKRRLRDALAAAIGTARALWSAPEVVWDVANITYFQVIAARLVAWLRRRALVVTWHEFFGDHWSEYLGSPWKGRLAKWIERLALACSPVAIVVSPLTRQRMLNAGYPPGRAVLVPNGVDVQAIEKLAPASTAGDWVYAGRLTDHKQVDLALRAFALAATRQPGLRFDIIGDGPDRTALETLAKDLGVAAVVRFHGFLPDEADVFRTMKACRVAVLPSKREGFGLAAIQAWACGLAVVVCDEPENAMTGLVDRPQLGRVVRSEPAAVAAACAELLADDSPMGRLRRVERAREFDLARMTEAVEAVYDAALARRLGGRT